MKQYLLLFSLCYAGNLFAQDTTGNFMTEHFGRQYDFYSKDIVSQPLLKLPQYAIVEAGYRYTAGNYILSQDAPKQRYAFFRTQGTKQVKKFLLSGSFAYEHTNQDSVGYTLRYDLYNPAPYYVFAVAKGNWEISRYHLQGIISHPLLNDKLTVGAAASYDPGNAWRSNDPRPEYTFFDIRGQATVHYRLLPHHTIGAAGGIIKKRTETQVDYRNKNYQLGNFYPDYNSFIQYGYGMTDPTGVYPAIRSITSGWNVEGIYHGELGKASVTAKGGYTWQATDFGLPAAGANELGIVYGHFYEDIINLDLYGRYRVGDNLWTANLHYLYHQGRDFHTVLNGNNYLYAFDQVSIQPLYARLKNNKTQYELGMQAVLSNMFRADGSAGITANYQYMNLGITGAYYHYQPAGNRFWKAWLQSGIQLPLSPELTQSTQPFPFIKGVVYRDYYYYGATVVTTSAEWLYQFPIHKTNTFFRLSGQYQYAAVPKDNNYPATTKPGSNRWSIQGSIGISL